MKRTLLRKILGGLSFTTALFVFQACYGTLQDFNMDILIEGTVKSKATGLPIKGIKVYVENESSCSFANDAGQFSFWAMKVGNLKISFEDIDDISNGLYQKKDTVITNPSNRLTLDIFLNNK